MKAVGNRNRMIRRRVLASAMVVLMLSTLITPGNGFGIRGTEANVNAASATSAITDPVDGDVNPAESQKGLPEDSPQMVHQMKGYLRNILGGDNSSDDANQGVAPAKDSLSSIYSTISATIETSDVNGNRVPLTQGDNSVELTDGSKIFTTLSWNIDDGKRVYTSTEYSYHLPDAVTFIDGSSGQIFGQVDGVGPNAYIGNYKIEDNVLKVTYNGDDGARFVAQDNRSTFVNIKGTLISDKCVDEGGGKKSFSFTGVGKFIFKNIVQNKDSVVNVSKTNAGFVTENGKLYQSYNVRITSTGDNTNVVFKDIPGSKLSYDSLIVKKNNGAATAGSDYTEVYPGTEYKIPSMSDNDYYDFTFKYEVGSDIYTSGQGGNNSTFTDETKKQLTNEAQVKSNEDSTVELAYGTPYIQAANWVEKSGTAQDDGTVKWEVYVNRYGNYPFSLAGLKIKDILGDNISAPESVTITAGNKDEWGNITYESSGTEVAWSTFANDYALGDALTYKIEYSTKVDTSKVPVGGSLNVKNTATVTTKDGCEFTSTGSVGVDDKTTYIRKEVESADPSTGEIVYKITVNVPSGSVAEKRVIDDNLGVGAIEYDYDETEVSLVANETTATFEKFYVEKDQYYKPHTTICFDKVENTSATDQQLVIRVKTKLSSLPTTTTTFRNSAIDSSYSKKTAEADYEYIPESFIKKSVIPNQKQCVLYKIDLLPLSDKYEGSTYTITDHIPEGMEFFADPSVNSYTVPKIYSNVNIHWLPSSQVLKDVAYTQHGKDVTFTLDADTIAALKAAKGNNPVYSIIYATRLSDYLKSASEDAKDYVNTASATVDGKKVQSVSATVNMKGDASNVLSKTGEYAATDLNENYDYATFKVAINNEKIILNNRQPIVVTDDMSGIDEFSLNLKTYPLSLKKEVKGENGNVSWANVDLTRVYTDNLQVNQYFYDGTNRTLKIKLDDATKYELEYKMIPVAKKGTEFTGTNSVTISGSSESSVKSDKTITGKIQSTSGGGSSGTGVTLSILKKDKEDNTKKLSGAIFSITEMELNKQDDGRWIVTDNIVKDLEPTDANGTTQAENLSYYVVYKIVETKAPDGYDLDPTPHYVLIRYQNDEVPPEGYADIPHQIYAYTANGLTAFDLDSGVAPYQYVAEDKPKGVEVTASKTLDGTTANTNGFQFSLKSIATSKSGLTLKNNNVDKTATSANGLVNFDKLVYDTENVGTYEYVMKETAVAGDYIFDDTVYTLRVEVSVDPETTILTAKGTWYRGDDSVKAVTENDKIEGNPSFNNISFATTDVSFNKNMDGQASKKAFDFTVQNVTSMNNGALVYKTDALNTFKNKYTNSVVDANSTVNVGTLKFSEAGTYAYRVAETNKTDKSIKYDNNVYLLEVLVEASADGKSLTATPKWYKTENAGRIRGAALNTAPVFDNASTGKLTVSKTVDGAPASANTKDYKFTVTKGTAPDLLYVQDAEGKLGTEEHVFTIQPGDENKFEIVNLELGTYKVTEKTDATDVDIDGYDYLLNDSTVSGTATLSALNKEASVGLINKYEEKKPELGDFTISKNFTLTPGNVLPQNANDEKFKVDITIKNENDEVATDVTGVHGDVTFANGIATDVEISAAAAITVKDIPQGYTYEVEEKALTEEQTVAGYVTDRVEYGNTDHKVSATTTKVTVYNGFKNPTVPTGSIKVKKNFTADANVGSVTPNQVTIVLHKVSDGDNTANDQTHTFAASVFANNSSEYEFSGLDTSETYSVTEQGVTVDKAGKKILTVTASDVSYQYEVSYTDNTALTPCVEAVNAPVAVITNKEVLAGTSLSLSGTKKVDAATIDASLKDKFSFTIAEVGGTYTETVTNDETGAVSFTDLSYEGKDAIGTYKYVIYESANDTNYLTDESAYLLEVTVAKSADGSSLVATKKLNKFASKDLAEAGSATTEVTDAAVTTLDFNNTSKPTGSIKVQKKFVDSLTGEAVTPNPVTVVLHKDADGTDTSKDQRYTFATSDFTADNNFTASHTFSGLDTEAKYTVTESGNVNGILTVTKADATYKYQVAEEDNSELSPNVDASKAPTALLTNTEVYTGVDVKLAGTKTVDGASIDSSLANKFTFTLENLDLRTTVTKTNDGTGKFDYAVGPFATIGTYNYVVYESANDTNLISDTSAYRVQIEIVKSADGSKLEAKKRVKKFATKVAAETGSLSDTDLVSGDISSLDFDNTSKTLTISKQSATGGDKELPGAKLILENSKHQKYEWTSGDTETTITSSDTFELVDGTYTLVEDTAPSGYTCITTTTFEIKDGKVVETSIQGSSNVTTKGGKILVKDQFTKLNIAKAITGTPTPLAGAKLQIIDKDDNVVKIGDTELKWDSTTTAKNITGIPVGTYTLQETEAPVGYKLAPDVKFTIDKYGTITLDSSANAETASLAADTKTITLYDEPIVIIKKTLTFDKNIYINESCSSNPAYKADATKAFAGAEFTLTQNGTSNTFTATSDETGKVSFTDLELGSYTLKETAVADGSNAKLLTDTYTVEVETDGCTIKNEAGKTVTSITNDITRTDISLVKVNEADPSKKLPDSTYGLYRKLTTSTDDAEITTDDAVKIAEATTDENGVLTFKGVLLDTEYVIKEEVAPDGYYVSDKPISVEFKAGTDGKPVLKKANGSNGTAVVNSVTGAITWNEPVVIYQFTKTDEDGNPLKGAELEIRDASGRVLDKWTSDGTAHVLEGILSCGESYKLVETKAPNGYDIADPVAFTVDETMDANQNYVGKISMVDKKTKATTEITTTETTTTDTTEVTTTETTTETKTETSSTTETKTETSSTTETKTIEKAKSTAKTGDNSSLAMVVALMCLAVAGILVLKDKKKKLNK